MTIKSFIKQEETSCQSQQHCIPCAFRTDDDDDDDDDDDNNNNNNNNNNKQTEKLQQIGQI
jgi:hypothetical protein